MRNPPSTGYERKIYISLPHLPLNMIKEDASSPIETLAGLNIAELS
jgi:hypothetical protein